MLLSWKELHLSPRKAVGVCGMPEPREGSMESFHPKQHLFFQPQCFSSIFWLKTRYYSSPFSYSLECIIHHSVLACEWPQWLQIESHQGLKKDICRENTLIGNVNIVFSYKCESSWNYALTWNKRCLSLFSPSAPYLTVQGCFLTPFHGSPRPSAPASFQPSRTPYLMAKWFLMVPMEIPHGCRRQGGGVQLPGI